MRNSYKLSKVYSKIRRYFSRYIDGATGSLYIPTTDIVLPYIHEEFKIERKYEYINPRCEALGKNWTTIDITENTVNALCSNGHVEIFNLIDDEWVNDKGAVKIYVLKFYKIILMIRKIVLILREYLIKTIK